MTLEDLKYLVETFGAGGGLIVGLGVLAIGVILPVLRSGRAAAKDVATDLVTDREMLIFMETHKVQSADFERRITRIERKLSD